MAIEDRESRLEVGYGLESILTDSYADDIINNEEVKEALETRIIIQVSIKLLIKYRLQSIQKPHKWIMN